MATENNSTDATHVSCDICLKEVPLSEATIPEATDYFVHFCGLECYEKWRHMDDSQKEKLKAPGA